MINLSRRKKLTHPKVGGIKPACLPSFRFILNSFLFLAIFFSFLSLSSPVLANEDLPAATLAKEEFFLTKIRTATFNCRPTGGNPAQRLAACLPRRVAERLLRGRWTKPVKIETFFRGHAQKSFSIKESIFAGFASLLTQGRAASTGGPHSNLSLRSRC